MGGGLAFLSKKRFNPSNLANQKQVWEARQRRSAEEKRAREREEELKREREEEDLARLRGGKVEGDKASLQFLYAPPPGMSTGSEQQQQEDDAAFHRQLKARSFARVTPSVPQTEDLSRPRAGDDEAAAAFRRMLAAAKTPSCTTASASASNSASSAGGAIPGNTPSAAKLSMTGTLEPPTDNDNENDKDDEKGKKAVVDKRTELEKAVGKRMDNTTDRGVSLEEQLRRFPQLQHAPRVLGRDGDDGSNTAVTFKPLGMVIHNVKCLACGLWGHSRGDRECAVSGWDPFATKAPAPPTTTPGTAVNQPTLTDEPKSSGDTREELNNHTQRDKDGNGDHSDTPDGKRKRAGARKRRRHGDDGDDDHSSRSTDDDDSRDRRRRHRRRRRKRRERYDRKHRSRSRRRRRRDDDDGSVSDESSSEDDRDSRRRRRSSGDDDDDRDDDRRRDRDDDRQRRRRSRDEKSSRRRDRDDDDDYGF